MSRVPEQPSNATQGRDRGRWRWSRLLIRLPPAVALLAVTLKAGVSGGEWALGLVLTVVVVVATIGYLRLRGGPRWWDTNP